jgi:hypothetical protein
MNRATLALVRKTTFVAALAAAAIVSQGALERCR